MVPTEFDLERAVSQAKAGVLEQLRELVTMHERKGRSGAVWGHPHTAAYRAAEAYLFRGLANLAEDLLEGEDGLLLAGASRRAAQAAQLAVEVESAVRAAQERQLTPRSTKNLRRHIVAGGWPSLGPYSRTARKILDFAIDDVRTMSIQ